MKFRLLLSFGLLFPLAFPSMTRASWTTNGVPVCTNSGQQSNYVITPDGAGGAIVAWQDQRGSSIDIYAQRIDATGVAQWIPGGIPLCTAPDNQVVPVIASDGAGGAIVAWQDYRNGIDAAIYVQRINSIGSLKWAANGVSACTAPGSQYNPVITGDGSGGAIVAWEDVRSGIDSDIYVQRINLLGAVQWTATGAALCTAPNDQYINAISPDVAGVAVVVWVDFRNGVDRNIYAQRINSGVVSWAADGVPLCTATNDQDGAVMISDDVQGVISAWEDFRSGTTYDIYTQRLNKSGAPLWAANGVALCTATNDQTLPVIVPDGASGAIVAWSDNRLTIDSNIFAQRVTSSGTVAWAANGTGICTATGAQDATAMISDGGGGAIVAWEDARSDSFDVYALRVGATGASQWTANGVSVVSLPNEQSGPIITSSGSGAIVAWQDHRTDTNGDIYALLLDSSGGIPSSVRGASPALSMAVSENYPNPFTNETSFDVTLRGESAVSIEVFDVAGHRVRSISEQRVLAGASHLVFDGLDDRAHALPSGVYFFRVHAGSETVTKKMIIAR